MAESKVNQEQQSRCKDTTLATATHLVIHSIQSTAKVKTCTSFKLQHSQRGKRHFN